MKTKSVILVLGLLLAMTIPVLAGPPQREGTWANDEQYIILVPKEPVPAANQSQEELYVIGAVDPSNPQSPGHPGIGPHDHVIPLPPHNGGEFSAIWRVVLIVPGPNATANNIQFRHVIPPGIDLVYAADLGSGMVSLTSVEKLETAGKLGLITEIVTPIVFVCPVIGPKKLKNNY